MGRDSSVGSVLLPFLKLLVSGLGLGAQPGSGLSLLLNSGHSLGLRLGSVLSRLKAPFETLVM